jgi:SAM-dependent methyltransferase
MGRIDYDEAAAAAFRAARHPPRDGLAHWRDAVSRYLRPRPTMRILDLGAGTGAWSAAFTDWYDVEVVAIEPSAAMRARSSYPRMLAGEAAAIPLATDCLDGAWLSTMIHHVADLPAAAAELRRVLRPGAPILIRSAFPGRHEKIALFRFFPEAVTVLDTYPDLEEVSDIFAATGFHKVALESIPQITADSLATVVEQMQRDAHTPLKLLSDADYESGMARLRAAAAREIDPVVDELDLLVLR